MNTSTAIRVLVAEDDYLVSEEIARILGRSGYQRAGDASTGAEAVEMACELRPDVVLMDIKMPDLDGLEAARRIQQRCPTPIVILSAHESRDLVDEAGEAGVAAYLTKPPKAGEIERAITIAMARHADMMRIRELCTELDARNKELRAALEKVKQLSGLLPVCASCHKIRDDKGNWIQIEVYVRDHSEAEFTHGMCPTCTGDYFPGFTPPPHAQ